MKYPELKFDENHEPIIEGNFEFEIAEKVVVDSTCFAPWKKISFAWSVEMQQDFEAFASDKNKEVYEAFGEQLKQDFIKLLTEKQPFLDLVKKWKDSGLLDDLKPMDEKSNMARLLKSEDNQIVPLD